MFDSILYHLGVGKRSRYEAVALSTASWFLGGLLPSGRSFPERRDDMQRYPFVVEFLRVSPDVYQYAEEAGFHLAHQLLVGAISTMAPSELQEVRGQVESNKFDGLTAQTVLAFLSLTGIAIDPQSAGDLAKSSPAAVLIAVLVRKRVDSTVLHIIRDDVVQSLLGNSDPVARSNDRIFQRLIEGLGLETTLENLRAASRGSPGDST